METEKDLEDLPRRSVKFYMDESAIKGLDLNGSDLAAMRARSFRMYVEGYDTSLPVDYVKSALSKHFSSCGEVVFVSIPYDLDDGTLNRCGSIYILGDGAEEKALQLSGSEMGGRKIVATSTPKPEDCIKPTPEMIEATRAFVGSKMIDVRGYDTSLPADDIKKALINHFSSCGEIVRFTLLPQEHPQICSPIINHALIHVLGEGAEEKALQLNGSDMGGCKLVVAAGYQPLKVRPPSHIRYGYTVPARFTNPMKTNHNQKKKTNRNKK